MKFVTLIIWIHILIFVAMMLSCSVSKPKVQQFTVTKIYDGFFAAKNGKTTLLFGTQDSTYIGKIINVSIGKK